MMEELRRKLGAIDLSEQFDKLVKYRIPTGILAIDRVIHGGIPSGKITELYGGWSAGKSRLLLHIIAQVLELGGYGILIDTERALEAGLCDLVGLDVNHPNFIYVNPDDVETMEDVFKFIEKAIDEIRAVDPECFLFIGWDSLAATPTKDVLKQAVEEKANISAALRAKFVAKGIRKLSSKVFKTHSCFVIVNQLIDRFDVAFGDTETTPGGKAVKFHASLRIALRLMKKIKDEKTNEQIGNEVKLVIDKSRIGVPFGMVRFEMLVEEPISKYAGLFDYMARHGELKQSGAFYSFPGSKKKFFAKDFESNFEEWLKDDRSKQDTPSKEKD